MSTPPPVRAVGFGSIFVVFHVFLLVRVLTATPVQGLIEVRIAAQHLLRGGASVGQCAKDTDVNDEKNTYSRYGYQLVNWLFTWSTYIHIYCMTVHIAIYIAIHIAIYIQVTDADMHHPMGHGNV